MRLNSTDKSFKSLSIMEFFSRFGEIPITSMLLCATTLVLLLIRYANRRNHWKFKSSPPGPFGIPILGHLPLLGKQPHIKFTEWSKTYGPIFRIRFGSHPAVVINGLENIRSILLTSNLDIRRAIAGRPKFPSFRHLNEGCGVVFASIDHTNWSIRKSWMKKAVYNFCLQNRDELEECYIKRVDGLAKNLLEAKTINPRHEISVFCISSILDMISHSVRDEENLHSNHYVQQIIYYFNELNTISMAAVSDIYPLLSYFFKNAIQRSKTVSNIITDLLHEVLKFNLETYDQSSNSRDIADHFLKIISNNLEISNKTRYEELRVQFGLFAEFIGATESTVGTILRWAFLYIANFQEQQNLIRQEIREVAGDGPVRLCHEKQLIKTRAFLAEVRRISSPLSFLLPHWTVSDTTLGSYDVPKDTMIFFNVWSALNDPEVWTNPDCFIPERFIDERGELRHNKFLSFLHFGGGERRCIGQRMGLWFVTLAFANMINQCYLSPVAGEDFDFEAVVNFTYSPKEYNLLVKPVK